MATLSLPSFPIGQISLSGLAEAKIQMEAGYLRFKREIDQAVKFTNVPREILLPFMFLESKCQNVRNSHTSATGPMQLMPLTAVDTICIDKKRIGAEQKQVLIKLLGAKRVNGYTVKGMDGDTAIKKYGGVLRNELDNVELNILLGSMMLGWLIDGNTQNGKIDMERVIVKYNQGINAKIVGSSPQQILLYTRVRYGMEPANYILKMTGRNGYLTAYT